jgi:hypothetical protein
LTAKVQALVPLAHVANVQQSSDFYKLLGMEIRNSLRDPSGALQWVYLFCDQAQLMCARASGPIIASQQAVLFYLYSPDLMPCASIFWPAPCLSPPSPIPTTCRRAKSA